MHHRAVLAATAAALTALLAGGCSSDTSKPDPKRDQQWGLNALHLPGAWKKAKGKDTVIAVVDTGVDLHHPDLEKRLVDGYDFVDNDKTPDDRNGHGTHVAGIAAADTDNGIGIAGGAPDAKIMPVRVMNAVGSGAPTTIAHGIVWAADHGANVINLSLGESGQAAQLLKNGILNPAINHAFAKGAVVVAAAGNEGTHLQPYRPSTHVLVVGASDSHGNPASFSNFGAKDAVSAPGVHILSTLPTHTVALTAKDGNTSGYGYLDGTSMATPYVSAVAALLHQQGRSPAQIMAAIQHTASNPHHNAKLGLGNVNAQAAVDSAK